MGGELVQGGEGRRPGGAQHRRNGRSPFARREAAGGLRPCSCGLQGVKKEQPPQGLPH